jgi:ketosteroid isomerase-like protein
VNFVLLRDDPLADISNLRSVQAVWKNAERFERTEYRSRFPRADVAETPSTRTGTGTGAGPATPQALVDAWLAMWQRYDLDRVADLFVNDDALTYFPSDREGLIEGFAAVRAYLEDLGFVSGGFQPESEMWLEQVNVSDFGESAVVGAVWYFGNRLNRRAAGRGPLTMALARVGEGWRISHINFGNYQPER